MRRFELANYFHGANLGRAGNCAGRKTRGQRIKSIEIIGEAGARVSPEIKSATPAIPWADIAGMRNRLIHAYFDVDLDILWETVMNELPPLQRLLETILAEME